MITNLFNKFFSGHERSVKAKKNILGSFALKGMSMLISLLLVPLTIDYLNPTKYGIWITLMSVIAWFNFFDVGLGNGLRNKFATAKAEGKDELARTYISTTYAIITIISISLFIIFFLINHFLNWGKILNTTNDLVELEKLVFIVFSVFCMQFIVKLINVIFIADQRPVMSNLINTTASLVSLITVVILMKTTKGSLFYLGASFSLINLIIPLLAGIWFFNTSYKKYKPTFSSVDFSHLKELVSLGMRFFIMQGAALVVFMTDNMIITQTTGPQDVTPYNIAYKYFGIVTMVFTIVTTPLWSAYTEAYVKKDFSWIRQATKKVYKLWGLVFVGLVVMLLVSNYAYSFWVGDKVSVPFLLSAIMALWVLLSTSTMVFSNFLSGISKIKLSLWHSVFVSIINIPLSIFFAKNLAMGSAGVILASVICVFPRAIFQPIQYWKIINGKAKGIWNQ
ncbi:lipopolysaccharide biosynthesis protein [Vicingus serpentipes]|uniref:Lipopolysaccharide biosynthesis protein n=1 Tax=Vicingus serpentipes TaxID=1926625 RepID=A0A5C6RUM1_9FLAO|nr:lipopolysaccharide biosynthesis protein [Vicingus serpentipes]TXB65260.1 lipopolysaccharide biosynthesis protein [Vicingus serpentipes]